MGDPHDITNEIYYKKKYSSTLPTLKESFFVMAGLILFKFLFVYFPTSLKFGIGLRKHIGVATRPPILSGEEVKK